MVRFMKILPTLAVIMLLAGCGEASKQDILDKTKDISTKAGIEAALGKPDNINKFGPLEKWTYNASDGTVVFLITGDTVAMQATGDKATKK